VQSNVEVRFTLCAWHLKGEPIPIYMQVVDQQPDGTHSPPPELRTGSQDDDDALLEVRICIVPSEHASLIVVTDRVARAPSPIIRLRGGM
jgi:hypothetical protein